jgi:hypothetical protein
LPRYLRPAHSEEKPLNRLVEPSFYSIDEFPQIFKINPTPKFHSKYKLPTLRQKLGLKKMS